MEHTSHPHPRATDNAADLGAHPPALRFQARAAPRARLCRLAFRPRSSRHRPPPGPPHDPTRPDRAKRDPLALLVAGDARAHAHPQHSIRGPGQALPKPRTDPGPQPASLPLIRDSNNPIPRPLAVVRPLLPARFRGRVREGRRRAWIGEGARRNGGGGRPGARLPAEPVAGVRRGDVDAVVRGRRVPLRQPLAGHQGVAGVQPAPPRRARRRQGPRRQRGVPRRHALRRAPALGRAPRRRRAEPPRLRLGLARRHPPGPRAPALGGKIPAPFPMLILVSVPCIGWLTGHARHARPRPAFPAAFLRLQFNCRAWTS
jgi:hypothetical protein